MPIQLTHDVPVEKDLRAVLSARVRGPGSLDRLLGSRADRENADRPDTYVELRELRRSMRFGSGLCLAILFQESHCRWFVRVWGSHNQRYADLVRCRGGVRYWQQVDSIMRFVRQQFPSVACVTVCVRVPAPVCWVDPACVKRGSIA